MRNINGFDILSSMAESTFYSGGCVGGLVKSQMIFTPFVN
jgi:hypothetical protein